MRKTLLSFTTFFAAALAHAATLSPIQLLNPAGSTAGQVISSAGPSSAPAWSGVSVSTASGTLPIANGGTGATTQSGALSNVLGASAVPVANGGTGATTAANARSNLGVPSTGLNTYSGNQNILATAPTLTLDDTSGANASIITLRSNGTTYWQVQKTATNNYAVSRYVSGSFIDHPISCATATGVCTLTQRPVFGSATPWDSANLASPATTGANTFTGNQTIGLSTPSLILNETSGASFSNLTYQSAGTIYWTVSKSSANNFNISRYVSGSFVDNPISCATATGVCTLTHALVPSQTEGIVGTTTNNNAQAGSIGEVISSSVAVGSAVSLTTGTAANVTSISLTAGDWQVCGNVATNPGGTTTQSGLIGSISTTSATHATAPNSGAYVNKPYATASAGQAIATPVGCMRQLLSATTTVYLVVTSTFATSTNAAYGFIGARRMR